MQELILSPPWWRAVLPVLGAPYCIIKGSQAEKLVHSNTCTPAFMWVKEICLSWWKLLGAVTVTAVMRSTATGEAKSWVQSLWLVLQDGTGKAEDPTAVT